MFRVKNVEVASRLGSTCRLWTLLQQAALVMQNDGSRFNCQGIIQDEPLYVRSGYWSVCSHFCPTLQIIPRAFFLFFCPLFNLSYAFVWRRILMPLWWHRQMSHSERQMSTCSSICIWAGLKSCSRHWFLLNLNTKGSQQVWNNRLLRGMTDNKYSALFSRIITALLIILPFRWNASAS